MHEEVSRLLSAYLDGELTQADDQRVRVHLEECAGCRTALAELGRVRDLAGGLQFVDPPEDRMNDLERRLSVRVPRLAGWVLLMAGLGVWLVYAGYLFVTNPGAATWEKLTTGAVVIGAVLLLFSVARQRWAERRSDRYRGVMR
jgi:anti-sigma factor RsiW